MFTILSQKIWDGMIHQIQKEINYIYNNNYLNSSNFISNF